MKGLSNINQKKYREALLQKGELLIDQKNEFIHEDVKIPNELKTFDFINGIKILEAGEETEDKIGFQGDRRGTELLEIIDVGGQKFYYNQDTEYSILDVKTSYGKIQRLSIINQILDEVQLDRFGIQSMEEYKEILSSVCEYFPHWGYPNEFKPELQDQSGNFQPTNTNGLILETIYSSQYYRIPFEPITNGKIVIEIKYDLLTFKQEDVVVNLQHGFSDLSMQNWQIQQLSYSRNEGVRYLRDGFKQENVLEDFDIEDISLLYVYDEDQRQIRTYTSLDLINPIYTHDIPQGLEIDAYIFYSYTLNPSNSENIPTEIDFTHRHEIDCQTWTFQESPKDFWFKYEITPPDFNKQYRNILHGEDKHVLDYDEQNPKYYLTNTLDIIQNLPDVFQFWYDGEELLYYEVMQNTDDLRLSGSQPWHIEYELNSSQGVYGWYNSLVSSLVDPSEAWTFENPFPVQVVFDIPNAVMKMYSHLDPSTALYEYPLFDTTFGSYWKTEQDLQETFIQQIKGNYNKAFEIPDYHNVFNLFGDANESGLNEFSFA